MFYKMKKYFAYFLLVFPVACFLISCGGDDSEEDSKNINSTIVINEKGVASNGSKFVAIDDKNFYLDYVKYSVKEGHLEVTGYDTSGFNGVANIVSSITYKGNFYEVLIIARRVFEECSRLTSVSISNSVTEIKSSAFYGCNRLTSVTIGNNVKVIDYGVFYGCSSLTTINIPNSITLIDDCAFRDCTSLTSITIPNSVKAIGQSVFSGCSNLKTIHCKSTQPIASIKVICDSNTYENVTLYVPKGSLNAYKNNNVWSKFGNIVEE